MRLKPHQERLLQLPKPPSPRRTRPTPQLDSEDSYIILKTFSYHYILLRSIFFKLLTYQSFFDDIPCKLQARRDPHEDTPS